VGAGGREGGLEGDFWPAGKENVHVTHGEFLVAVFISLNVWDLHIVEHEILAFFVSQLGHALEEGNINRRRPRLDANQSRHARSRVAAARAPVEICLGTSPSHAPKSRPFENASPVPVAAWQIEEASRPSRAVVRDFVLQIDTIPHP
jgi:hypothetical protein